MSSRKLAWGLGGGISLLVALGCSGKNLNEVGDVGTAGKTHGSAGSSSSAGTGTGDNDCECIGCVCATAGTYSQAGAGSYGGFGGTGSAGEGPYAGTSAGGSTAGVGGTGIGGYHPGCFADYNPNNTGNDDAGLLALGPQNAVFVDTHYANGDVKNYADQLVFPTSGVWEAYANFPAVSHELALDTTVSMPADIASAPANFGQLYLTRQTCKGMAAGGHTLKVEVWWKLGGAIVHWPTEGMALGAIVKNKAVWFDDATKAFVTGGAEADRPLNTLNRIVLEHTFADGDETDASKLVLGLWLMEDFAFPTTFYVGNVKWE